MQTIGAALGAVGVPGGAEYVRMPRLPAEKPPRGRTWPSTAHNIKNGRDSNERGQRTPAKHGIDLPDN
jgi:hypothetical protein